MRALNIGATGMLAQQTNVEVISNNIANMNTTAYTKRRTEFQDLLYQNMRRIGAPSSDIGTIVPSGIQIGLGVKVGATYRITETGSLISTSNPLDLAIQGKGYFQIELPDGTTAYTRDGAFQLNPDREIVTHDGYTVQPGITLPEDVVDISINASGEVWVKVDGETDLINAGQLEIATFPNEAGLDPIGDNLFLESTASGAPVTDAPAATGFGSILQQFLEGSNVNVVSEVTDLVNAQRAYEMNSKVITTADNMLSVAVQIKS